MRFIRTAIIIIIIFTLAERKIIIIIIIVELIKRSITATRAVSLRFTTYYYRDRPVHSRASFDPPLGHTSEKLISAPA